MCSCSCEFCHVVIWILRGGSSAHDALLSVCLSLFPSPFSSHLSLPFFLLPFLLLFSPFLSLFLSLSFFSTLFLALFLSPFLSPVFVPVLLLCSPPTFSPFFFPFPFFLPLVHPLSPLDEIKVVAPPERKHSVCRVFCGTTTLQGIVEHIAKASCDVLCVDATNPQIMKEMSTISTSPSRSEILSVMGPRCASTAP